KIQSWSFKIFKCPISLTFYLKNFREKKIIQSYITLRVNIYIYIYIYIVHAYIITLRIKLAIVMNSSYTIFASKVYS
ncbi:MAG: hypothetical protein N7Q72_04040, partial [Spiroplasma sp. Tabriz.8]|nr:hypothetical protein [Spiroplasma sp. Tabriz.8]